MRQTPNNSCYLQLSSVFCTAPRIRFETACHHGTEWIFRQASAAATARLISCKRPGYEFHRIWGSDSIPELPSDGTPPPQPRYFPPKSGFRFAFFTIPPDTGTSVDQIDIAAALEEIQQKLPGMMDVLEPDHPGMHTTDTVDFDVIVSGEVYLEWDDRAELLLKAGDCMIQNGTRHAWHNRSSEKCVIAVAIVGAERKP